MDLLRVEDLAIHFESLLGAVRAVDHISFVVPRGTVLGIVGESGSGKSTVAVAVMNLLTDVGGYVDSGKVWFEGQELLKLSPREMCAVRGASIAMIFQEPMSALNPSYTVYQQINEVYKIHGKGNRSKEELVELLMRLNFAEPQQVLSKYPFELSGGMRQRVVIAMAIALNPPLLIADEPTTALDMINQAEVLQLFKDINNEIGSAILFITHDLDVIAEVAQRVIVMYQGRIVEENDVLGFFDAPLHPYTQDLLRARPGHFNGRFASIPGGVEAVSNESNRCPYAPRCHVRMKICAQQKPPEIWLDSHRRAACWRLSGENLREKCDEQ